MDVGDVLMERMPVDRVMARIAGSDAATLAALYALSGGNRHVQIPEAVRLYLLSRVVVPHPVFPMADLEQRLASINVPLASHAMDVLHAAMMELRGEGEDKAPMLGLVVLLTHPIDEADQRRVNLMNAAERTADMVERTLTDAGAPASVKLAARAAFFIHEADYAGVYSAAVVIRVLCFAMRAAGERSALAVSQHSVGETEVATASADVVPVDTLADSQCGDDEATQSSELALQYLTELARQATGRAEGLTVKTVVARLRVMRVADHVIRAFQRRVATMDSVSEADVVTAINAGPMSNA
jgi:hypothetical protein